MKSVSTPSQSDSGSSQFEQIDLETVRRDVPEIEQLSIAYRASLHARIGGDLNDIKSLKQKNKLLKGAVEKERAAKTELVKQLKELREQHASSLKSIEKHEEKQRDFEQQLNDLQESLLLEKNNSMKFKELYRQAREHREASQGQVQQASAAGLTQESFLSGFGQILGISSSSMSSKATPGVQQFSAANGNNSKVSQVQVSKLQSPIVQAEGNQQQASRIPEDQLQVNKNINSNSGSLPCTACAEAAKLRDIEQEQHKHQLEEFQRQLDKLQSSQKAQAIKEEQKTIEISGKLELTEKKLHQISSECESAKKRVKELEQHVSTLETHKIMMLQQQKMNLSSKKPPVEEEIISIQMVTLKRVIGINEEPCQIICRRDIEGQHLIEFDSIKDRFSLNALDLQDVICDYDPEPILTLPLTRTNQLVFKADAQNMRKAEKIIRQFVRTAPCLKSTNRPYNQQQATLASQKDSKGFVGNFYNFFK